MALWGPPNAPTGCVGLWLDAMDHATILNAAGTQAADQELVAQWLDKSVSSGCRTGTPRHATQATASKQPRYLAQAPKAPSGMPGVATPQYYNGRMIVNPPTPAWDNTVGQGALVVAVNPGADYGACTMFSSGAATGSDSSNDNGGPQLRFDNNGVRLVRSYQADLGSARNDLTSAAHIAGFNAGGGQFSIYANDLSNDQSGDPAFNNPMSLIFSNINGAEPFVGPILEILYFLRRLTASELSYFQGYLAWKWGIQANLQDSHQFRNAAPTTGTDTGGGTAPVTYTRRRSGLIIAS